MARQRRRAAGFALCVLVAAAASARAQQHRDLTELSLEELANLEVTSVSRKPESRARTAAAVHVITGEDVRRTGTKSYAETLRLAPGVNVARVRADQWSVGIRGFSSPLSRSMLVLMDGRSVYTPLFAGVYWEAQDTLLEDVDRIEVVRGPGGSLWGANAVNGVVNLITKKAKVTQGLYAELGGGSEERGFGGVRYGGALGRSADYRVYAKYFDRGATPNAAGSDFDAWHVAQGGFRVDWDRRSAETVTLQGDIYDGRAGQRSRIVTYAPPFTRTVEDPVRLSGGNLLGRWQRGLASGSNLSAQLYYDRTRRVEPAFSERRDTVDLDLQHHFGLGRRHDVVWGLGGRISAGRTEGVPTLVFDPPRRTDRLLTGFVQDEIALAADRLHLIVGAKLEDNDYSGFEVQPSARLLWRARPRQTVWLAASRAVRTPSRADADLVQTVFAGVQGAFPIFLRTAGDKQVVPEKAHVYEAGYRVQAAARLAVDVAAFYNRYGDLLGARPGTPFVEPAPPSLRLVIPLMFRNLYRGEGYGAEIAVDAQATPDWRLYGAYSYLELQVRPKVDAPGQSNDGSARNNPRHKLMLRSSFDLPAGLSLDASFRYVGRLPGPNIPSYTSLDARLAWRPSGRVELAAVGQNLLHDRHAEFSGGSQVPRGAYGQATLRW